MKFEQNLLLINNILIRRNSLRNLKTILSCKTWPELKCKQTFVVNPNVSFSGNNSIIANISFITLINQLIVIFLFIDSYNIILEKTKYIQNIFQNFLSQRQMNKLFILGFYAINNCFYTSNISYVLLGVNILEIFMIILAGRSRLRPVVLWKKSYINMTINIIHVLSNVVKINSNIKNSYISQFFYIFKNIFAYNSKTVIATDPEVVSFKR